MSISITDITQRVKAIHHSCINTLNTLLSLEDSSLLKCIHDLPFKTIIYFYYNIFYFLF